MKKLFRGTYNIDRDEKIISWYDGSMAPEYLCKKCCIIPE